MSDTADIQEQEYDNLDDVGQVLWLFLGHFFELGKKGAEWDTISKLVADKREMLEPYLAERERLAVEAFAEEVVKQLTPKLDSLDSRMSVLFTRQLVGQALKAHKENQDD